jgi:hypothetical protein
LPGKYRYESKRSNKSKAATRAKTKGQTKEMTLVELTERVEKAVVLIVVE